MTERVSNEEATERVEQANNPESLSVRACADLLAAREALRLTNIDVLYERVRANDAEQRIKELEQERDEARGVVACLHAEQNGPPLIHHEAAWNAAMARAEAVLSAARAAAKEE